MEIAFLIGRIIVGLYYLFNGINHFSQNKTLVAYAKSHNVPLAEVAVPFTGVLLLVAGLSILTGIWPLVGVVALVVFLLPVSLMMHNFWAVADPMQRALEMVNFLKNMALLGSALMFLAIPQPWPFSVSF